MRLSLALDLTSVRGGGSSLAAPGLLWDGDTGNDLPYFTVTFNTTAAVSDTVEMERDTDSGFGSPDSEISTVTSIGPTVLSGWAFGAWPSGTYYVRIRHGRGASVSGWSNTETVTISTGATEAFWFLPTFRRQ